MERLLQEFEQPVRDTGGILYRVYLYGRSRPADTWQGWLVFERTTDRQRFATEAKGRDTLKIVERRDLAGGVARYRQRQVFGRNAAAIVTDADQADAAFLEVDVDAPRTRIKRVLDQFLDHGSGSLDDFACSDLVDEGVG